MRLLRHLPEFGWIRNRNENEDKNMKKTAEKLIAFIKENEKTADDGMWETNIFGKSIEQLVEDGIRTKIAQISEESQVKLQDTMQKIVNDSKGGLICIII